MPRRARKIWAFWGPKPGKFLEAPQEFVAGPGVLPDGGGVSVVVLDEVLAQLMDALAHGTGIAVHGRLGREQRGELLRVVRGDLVRVEIVRPHALSDRVRPREGPLHRHLLVQQHADQGRERAAAEQFVGLGLLGEVKSDVHGSMIPRAGAGRSVVPPGFGGPATRTYDLRGVS